MASAELAPTLYGILGVAKRATHDELRQAFHRQALCLHPDKGGRKEDFVQVMHAFRTLADPIRRVLYDKKLTPPPRRPDGPGFFASARPPRKAPHCTRPSPRAAPHCAPPREASPPVSPGPTHDAASGAARKGGKRARSSDAAEAPPCKAARPNASRADPGSNERHFRGSEASPPGATTNGSEPAAAHIDPAAGASHRTSARSSQPGRVPPGGVKASRRAEALESLKRDARLRAARRRDLTMDDILA